MNRKIYIFEVCLFLLPVTVLYVPAFFYLFFIPLGDIGSVFTSASIQRIMEFISYQALTVLCACSIYSLWFASLEYIEKKQIIKFSVNPYKFTFILIGVVISIITLLELIFPNHFLKQLLGIKEHTGFFALYFFGAPVSIPALHMLFMSLSSSANE